MMEKQTKIGTIPEGWKVKKLKEVFHINELSLPSNTDANYKFKYIPIEFVSTNHIDYGNCESFRFVDAPGRARRIVRENDILISGVRPNLKSFAVFKKPDDSNWICSTGFYVLTAKEESDNLFSYYELLSEIGESQFYSYVAGSNYPAIGDGDIRNMKLMFPKDKSEQTAIAAILSKVDEAIAAVQASISAVERMKKSLMQNLLTGRMKPDGTLRKEDEFYVDEKFGKVPLGWEVKRLKDICLNSGDYGANASAIDYDETKPRFIRITDIDDFGQLMDEGKASMAGDNTTKYMLEEDDFLFARTGDTVGKSLLYKKEMGPAVYAGYLIKFTFDKAKVLPEYFDLIAKSEFFEAFKIAMKRVGAKPNINSREYCSFRFLLPSDIEEQKEIFGRFAHIDKTQKAKQNKIAILERLKKSLMQNLLTGRVRINEQFKR